MWTQNWRNVIWQEIEQPWDLVIVGGGITGAGILREAARLGLRCLLVEMRDFGWGTSSKSSKLVHGGLRYLKEGQIGLTRDAVHEREELLAFGPGLVEPIGFLLATYKSDKIGRLVYRAGLSIYDLLALQWSHKYYAPADFQLFAPHLSTEGLKGGFHYGDAQTDDARLVLRVLQEAVAAGNGRIQAINYTSATQLLKDADGRVTGITLQDQLSGQTAVAPATVIINATGAWADQLRSQVDGAARLRPLRGSHLVFPTWRLPVAQAVTFLHPIDQRPVMIFPWEGVTLVGTTDVDHHTELNEEPAITADEVAYLMAAVQSQFASLNLQLTDIIASFAGVRPVIGSGKDDPSEESRDHVVWAENGLLTVTGGKLTTYRLIALDALTAVADQFPHLPAPDHKAPILDATPPLPPTNLPAAAQRRLHGRYAATATDLIAAAHPDELTTIPGTPILWAELRWAARAEGVIHLEDLLLRRVRLGLLLPQGGAAQMPRIRAICQEELGWSDGRWLEEEAAYQAHWQRYFHIPPPETIPDWRQWLPPATEEDKEIAQRPLRQPMLLAAALTTLAALLFLLWQHQKRNA